MDLFIVERFLTRFILVRYTSIDTILFTQQKMTKDCIINILLPNERNIDVQSFEKYRKNYIERCEYWLDIMCKCRYFIEIEPDEYMIGYIPVAGFELNNRVCVEKKIEEIYQRIAFMETLPTAAASVARTEHAMYAMKRGN
jgi:hypothetical protein